MRRHSRGVQADRGTAQALSIFECSHDKGWLLTVENSLRLRAPAILGSSRQLVRNMLEALWVSPAFSN